MRLPTKIDTGVRIPPPSPKITKVMRFMHNFLILFNFLIVKISFLV